jgi:hypothetical protein
MSVGQASSMQNQSLTSILLFLHPLTLPAFVVHVGAGRGIGELNVWQSFGVPNALIVDADADRLNWVHKLCAQHTGWKIVPRVISNQVPECPFYQANNPDEDSLVALSCLTAIWENIRTTKAKTVSTVSLDDLIIDQWPTAFDRQISNIWCLIDCLPADSILFSAEKTLAHMSVVVTRVVLADLSVDSPIGLLSVVSPFLEGRGFKCLSVLETTHPALGYAVFVRDYKSTYEHYVDKAQLQLKTWQSTVEQQREQISEQRSQIDSLILERNAKLENISTSLKTIEAQQLEVNEVRQQLEKMEGSLVETNEGKLILQVRQTHLHDNLVRAEAQIDLIKELMFTSIPPLQS